MKKKDNNKSLHCINRQYLYDIVEMYGDEIQFSQIGDMYFYVYLTEEQFNELLAIEFPMIY